MSQPFLQDADIEVDVGRSEATIRITIPNFSNIAKDKASRFSPTFYLANKPWKIEVDTTSGHFEIFLCCTWSKDDESSYFTGRINYRIPPEATPTSVNIMTFSSKNDRQRLVSCRRTGSFFYRHSTKVDSSTGYVKNDAVTLEICVFVTSIVPCTSDKIEAPKCTSANELIQAIILQDVERCTSLLEENKNHEDINGRKPLMFAAYKGNLQIVQLLVETSCKINIADIFGFTPLMRAVQFGHLEVVKYLLEKGADINNSTVHCLRCNYQLMKFTALHLAVNHGKNSQEMVKLLINEGADLSSIPAGTAVHLISQGVRSLVDSSTIIWAIEKTYFELTKELLKAEECINDDRCPLMHALRSDDLEIVQMLLDKGADPSKRDKTGRSAFLESVMMKNLEKIKCLSKYGSPLMFHTSLHTGILTQEIPIIEILLENGASVNVIGEDGDSPLTKSIRLANLKLVEFLVKRGAEVNLKDRNGCIPIFESINNSNLEIVKFLLKNGSDINIFDDSGSTPLLQCVKKGTLKILEVLVESGVDVNKGDENTTPLMESLNRGKSVFVKFLMDNGANANFSNEEKEKILSATIKTENLSSLMHLIEGGVDFSPCQHLLDKLTKANFDFAAYRAELGNRKALQPAENVSAEKTKKKKKQR